MTNLPARSPSRLKSESLLKKLTSWSLDPLLQVLAHSPVAILTRKPITKENYKPLKKRIITINTKRIIRNFFHRKRIPLKRTI